MTLADVSPEALFFFLPRGLDNHFPLPPASPASPALILHPAKAY